MRKRLIKIYCCAIALAVIAAAAWGISARGSYTDVTSEAGYLDGFVVAEMSEASCAVACEDMYASLDDSPVIVQVTCTGDIEHLFAASQQSVVVDKVFKGEGLSEGDEIYLTSSRWRVIYRDSYMDSLHAIERGFVNILKQDEKYLAFISAKVAESDGRPVYMLSDVENVAPVFCYEDAQNVIAPVPLGNTYVPYSDVRDNEFFVTSQESLDMILGLKDEFIQKYPISK